MMVNRKTLNVVFDKIEHEIRRVNNDRYGVQELIELTEKQLAKLRLNGLENKKIYRDLVYTLNDYYDSRKKFEGIIRGLYLAQWQVLDLYDT